MTIHNISEEQGRWALLNTAVKSIHGDQGKKHQNLGGVSQNLAIAI